MEPRLKWQH